jgi:sulfite oxidase
MHNPVYFCCTDERSEGYWCELEMWHHAFGGELISILDYSWQTVLREKDPDMLHLFKVPCNGDRPKRLVTSKVVTPNPLHLVRNDGGIPLIGKRRM